MQKKYEMEEGEILTPGNHGAYCRHNGGNSNYELACDECDYYLVCFPEEMTDGEKLPHINPCSH